MSLSSFNNHFNKCDEIRETYRTQIEEERYNYLLRIARTSGIGGKERLEFLNLQLKKAYL